MFFVTLSFVYTSKVKTVLKMVTNKDKFQSFWAHI